MPKFKIDLNWSGYSRGTSTYIVDAESSEEAKEMWYEGERVAHDVVRDDTEKDDLIVTEIT